MSLSPIKKSIQKRSIKSEGSSPENGYNELYKAIQHEDLKIIKLMFPLSKLTKFEKNRLMKLALKTENTKIIEYLSMYIKKVPKKIKQEKYLTSPFDSVFKIRKSPSKVKNINFITLFTEKNIDAHFFEYLSVKYKNICNIYCFRDIYNITENEEQGSLITAYKNNKIWKLNIKFNIQLFKDWMNSCKKNFILIPLTLKSDDSDGHQNILVINKHRQELERFEPNGYIKNDKGLNNLLRKLSLKLNLKYISMPIDRMGLQEIQSNEQYYGEHIEFPRKNDPGGFCVPWSLLYAHLRLTYNPSTPMSYLIGKATSKCRINKSYTSFIRNYSNFVINSTKYFNHNIKKCPKTTERARSLISFKTPLTPVKRRYSEDPKHSKLLLKSI